MVSRTVWLDDVKGLSADQLLRDVDSRQEALTVRMPEGGAVTIHPSPKLKPLLTFRGTVPEGWKADVYE